MSEVTTRVELAQVRMKLAKVEAERDSLAASLEATTKELEKCAAEAEAFRTGMGNGVTILPTEWLDKDRAELSELRARVEEALARCQRTISAWNTNHDAVSDFRCEEASDLLAILAPPEGP